MAMFDQDMISLVQSQINHHYNVKLDVDGIAGPALSAALYYIPTLGSSWSNRRRIIGAVQHFATLAGFNAGPIDGYIGPQTAQAFTELSELHRSGVVTYWRDEIEPEPPTHQWPLGDTKSMTDHFGSMGMNQTAVRLPYDVKLAWNTSVVISQFTCNKLVVPHIQAAMEQILNVYGRDFIKEHQLDHFGGALNVRKMRGSSTRWSSHSWGTSIDWNPVHNQLRWDSDRAQLADVQYVPFWEAWEAQGAVSLGRTKNFDWMHVGFNR